MSTMPENPSRDDGDENPDLQVGEPVEAQHDLDVTAFVEDDSAVDVNTDTIQ